MSPCSSRHARAIRSSRQATGQLAVQGLLVTRPREQLEARINQFAVCICDSMVIACAALLPYEDGCAEIACVAVHSTYLNKGKGDATVSFIEAQAAHQGVRRLFALTTKASAFFSERGYRLATVSELPRSKAEGYNYGRNSRIYIKVRHAVRVQPVAWCLLSVCLLWQDLDTFDENGERLRKLS